MHWAVIDSAARLVVRVASSVARRSPVAKARISFDASRDPGDGDVGPTAMSAFSQRPDVIFTAMSFVQFDRLHLPAFCVRDQASACRSQGYPLRRHQRGTCTGTLTLDADVDRSTLMPPRLGSTKKRRCHDRRRKPKPDLEQWPPRGPVLPGDTLHSKQWRAVHVPRLALCSLQPGSWRPPSQTG